MSPLSSNEARTSIGEWTGLAEASLSSIGEWTGLAEASLSSNGEWTGLAEASLSSNGDRGADLGLGPPLPIS